MAKADPLEGKVALVTGAGRGIGRAVAVELAGAGARVALLARSRDQLEQTSRQIAEQGGHSVVVPADVSDGDQVAAALARVRDSVGAVDVLVNNAAVVWPLGPSKDVDADEWAAALNTNVVAVARLTFATLPTMLERKWGRIVNVSSGVVARPASMIRGNAYVTAKAGLEAHTVNLAAELADTGVTANVFRPGMVDTAMQEWIRGQDPADIGEALHEHFRRSHAEGALITPQVSARSMVTRLRTEDSGSIWDVTDSA
jgi:NAD(P)-dependent dehydrogenase (short-subunit alcohol dehydrogenase family)